FPPPPPRPRMRTVISDSCSRTWFQLERHDDPRTFGAQRLPHEGVMSQWMRDAVAVVLDVRLVIVEVGVPTTGCRGEQNVEPPLERYPAQPRADGTRDHAVDHQRPFEVPDEQPAEVPHFAAPR